MTNDPSQPLKNARHEKFCQLMAKGDTSQTRAYLAAGYDCTEDAARSSVCELLANPSVEARIEHLQQIAASEASLSRAEVLHTLREVVIRGLEKIPLYDRKGRKVGEKSADLAAANRALELLGKHLGMFKEKPQEDIRHQVARAREDLKGFSVQELTDRYLRKN